MRGGIWHAKCLRRSTTIQTDMKPNPTMDKLTFIHSTAAVSLASLLSLVASEPDDIHKRASGNGVSLAIDHNGTLFRGPRGGQLEPVSFKLADRVASMAFAKGRFVAVGREGRLRMSTNGIDWEECAQPEGTYIRSVAANDDGFVAVGGSFIDHKPVILRSSGGHGWIKSRSPGKAVLLDVTWGDGMFVAVGDRGMIVRSADGRRWRRSESRVTGVLACLAHLGGRYVAGGEDGLIITSVDGRHWSWQESFTREYVGNIQILHNQFRIAAMGTHFRSSDGERWISEDTVVISNDALVAGNDH